MERISVMDVVVIGAGPAGMTAALTLRDLRTPYDWRSQWEVNNTADVENYPGSGFRPQVCPHVPRGHALWRSPTTAT